MKWFKKQQGNTMTVVRCCQNATYVAKVARKKNAKPLVELTATEPTSIIDTKISETTQVLKQTESKKLVDQYHLDTNPVTYLLESTDCHHIQIEKPNVPADEMKEAARWAIKDSIEPSVDEITLDIIDIPIGQSGEDVTHDYIYVMYAKNERIALISNALYQDKVNLKAIDSRIMAQRNIANQLAEPEKAQALLTFSSGGALLTFSNDGELCNARFIDISIEQTDSSFEKISLEIQRSLDGFESNFRNMFVDKVLVAPFEYRDQFCEHLQESLYTKVETFELTDVFDFADEAIIGDSSNQARFLPILGAALREEAPA